MKLRLSNLTHAGIAAILVAHASTAIYAETPAPVKADNSAVNHRDAAAGEVTAESQGSAPADVELTRQIREAVMSDKGLSTYAHNVKIISNNGQVTLKGPVRSANEKSKIEQAAVKLAGKAKVSNQLEIAR